MKMKYTYTPPAPLEFGRSVEHYRTIIQQPFYRDLTVMESLKGKVDFAGEIRHVSVGFTEGRALEFEINSLEPGDTFLDIPLPMRTRKFRNELKKQGVETINDNGGVVIPEQGVSFYIYEGETATICWSSQHVDRAEDSSC